MDSKYMITSSGNFVSFDELYHWGIKGMKWGIRRYQNKDGSLTDRGKKRYGNSDDGSNKESVKTSESGESGTKSSSRSISNMSDAELQAKVNRLRNEDAYNDLSKKLGYDSPKTELDKKIADMEKQKKYLELQRDINNLTPKKVSKGKKFIDGLMTKVIEPAATEVGKNLLKKYLGEAGSRIFNKTAPKAENVKNTVKDSYESVKQKEAKREAKRQSRSEKKSTVYEGIVEGVGNSSKKSSSRTNNSTTSGVVYDSYRDSDGVYRYANSSVTSMTTTSNTSAGRSWVSSHNNTSVSGLLSAPKDDDD